MNRISQASLAALMCATSLASAQTAPTSLKFDFGSSKVAPEYIKVTPTTIYTSELGYGFEPGSTPRALDRGGKDPLKADFITSNKPLYFSVKVPQDGNYRVTVILGDRKAETTTTVKAELRRLMLKRIHTAKGKFTTVSFLVNVRTPAITGGEVVRLKDREKTLEAWAWDDKLTLEFTDVKPAVCGLEIEKDDKVPTIYIAGDSTSTDQPREPFNSWGQMLPSFFKPEVAIANHGESGESLRGFINEKRLDKVMSLIHRGDWLLIQMGHNDQKEKGEGLGAFTSYKADLKLFVSSAREHGATPVLITSVNRLTFGLDGKITDSLGDYPEAVRQVGREENVPVIDLNVMSAQFYEALGPQNAQKAFAGKDITHHNNYGSYETARCIVQGIKDNGLQIAKYLFPIPEFNPSKPDPIELFDVPSEPAATLQTPYGH